MMMGMGMMMGMVMMMIVITINKMCKSIQNNPPPPIDDLRQSCWLPTILGHYHKIDGVRLLDVRGDECNIFYFDKSWNGKTWLHSSVMNGARERNHKSRGWSRTKKTSPVAQDRKCMFLLRLLHFFSMHYTCYKWFKDAFWRLLEDRTRLAKEIP